MNGDPPRIRRAGPEDAPDLARMRFAFRAELGDAVEAEDAFVARCAPWMAERLAEGGPWCCWVAEDEGGIAGHAWVQLLEKVPNPVEEREHHAYVTNCYVVPARRGGGTGGRLLAAALAWCEGSGVDAVILWPSRDSRSLYRRHGFAAADDVLELRLPSTPNPPPDA